MKQKVLIGFVFSIFLSTHIAIGQSRELIPDTLLVKTSDVKNFNYSWISERVTPNNVYKNTGIQSAELDSFTNLHFDKDIFKLTYDTIVKGKSWRKDTSLRRAILFPEPIPIEKPRYKDFATEDIQFIDVDQGLSSSYILKVLEDSRKMMWFGTLEGGLIRYDGYSMYKFTRDNGLCGNTIRSLFEDSKGNMWIGAADNSFCMFDGHKVIDFSLIPELNDLYVLDFLEDLQGRIWIATRSKGIFIIDDTDILHIGKNNNLKSNNVYALYLNDKGVWVGSKSGLSIIRNDSIENYQFNNQDYNTKITAIHTISNNSVLIGMSKHLIICTKGKFTKVNLDLYVKGITLGLNGDVWIGTSDRGIFEVSLKNENGWRGSYKNYTEQYGLNSNEVSDLLYSNGTVWIGTYGGGINKLKTPGFKHITTKQGIGNDLVYSITEDILNRKWFATEKEGVAFLEDGYFKHLTAKNPLLKSNVVLSANKDFNSNVWFGSYKGGIAKYSINNLYKLNIINHSTPLSVISIFHDSKQRTWFGTFNQGVFLIEDTLIKQYSTKNGLINNDVYDILEDKNGNFWFATDGGLSFFDGRRFLNYSSKSGLPSDVVFSLYEVEDSSILVGTYGGGIAILKNGAIEVLNTKNGLSSDLVTSIIQDNKKRIWIGTEKGLNLLTRNNNTHAYNIASFEKDDGLKGLTFFANSVYIDSGNTIWWGTSKGITSLDLEHFKLNTNTPKVEIEAIQVKQKFPDFHRLNDSLKDGMYRGIGFDELSQFRNLPQRLTVSYDKRHVTFYYSVSQNCQCNVKYLTRLYPLEKEWSLPTEERKADYRGIPPGEYQFEVKAIINSEIYSQKAVQYLYVKSPWWMTQWMYGLYVLLLLVAIGLLHRWRTSVLIRRQYELERTVQKRTVEIQEKNEELNVLLDQITDQRNEIETQRDMVMQQKDQLEHINLSISQSIDYAQRIQSSLMPDYYEFREIFPDSFMIFKPRDIVSGDFFWWEETDNYIISIVADCTGHGVPGAFMSILGITFLREIVLKEKFVEPHQILNRLREEIITALKQKNIPGELRDGMDMTVVSIDKKQNTVKFSGAHNSIYHCKNGELSEIKGQKFPVAVYPSMKEFVSVEFAIQPGDAIYMFSDGYHDQLSEKHGKKIKKSRFFSLIERVANKEMKQQKDELVQFLDYWKGDYEQIDDILVLGFKIPNSF
jgi:ligand-binding sensor domain-containing protein/serine phosphatase RsbU (regulator of sigma subunit)